MKKIWSVMVLILLLSLTALPLLAEEAPRLTVTASVSSIYNDSNGAITFTVSLSGNKEFTSMGFALDYDSSVFEYVMGTGLPDNTLGSLNGTMVAKLDENTMCFTYLNGSAISYSGNVMSFTLRIKEGAELGDSSVTLKSASITTSDGKIDVAVSGSTVKVECDHSYNMNYEPIAGTDKHTVTCSKCGDKKTEEHDIDKDEGEVLLEATCTEAGKVKYTCDLCQAEIIEEKPATGHTNMTAWKSDGTKHWHECSTCGHKEGETAHTPGAAATDSKAQTCKVCGYVLAEALGHNWDAIWNYDGSNHWHRCSNSGCSEKKNYGSHVYDNACDLTCNTCGYVRKAPHDYGEEWLGDENGHYHICLLCGVVEEVIEHVPGDPATEDTPQTCTVCGYILALPLGHEHTFGESWKCDESGHWHNCSDPFCDGTSDKLDHEWGEPVTNEAGELVKTCTVCGYETTASVEPDPTDPPATEPETQPTEPEQTQPLPGGDDPGDSNEGDGFPWKIIAIAAVVLLCIGVILLVIELIREYIRGRKVNMHGKFSK